MYFRSSRNTGPKMEEDDDLFAGLGEPKTKAKPSSTNHDFMSSLFGSEPSKTSRRGSATINKEFVLEDKYIKPTENTVKPPVRRGSGTPLLNTEPQPKTMNLPEPQPYSQSTQLEVSEPPAITLRTPNSSVNENLHR